jgi:hypothetical protein
VRWPAVLLGVAIMAGATKTLEPPQPVLTSIYPAGGRQGTTVEVTLSGTGIEPRSVLVSGEGVRTRVLDANRVAVEIAPEATPGVRELRVLNAGGVSNRSRFVIGDLPEAIEAEPNSDKLSPHRIESLPVVMNGQILEGDRDYFRFHASAGETVVCQAQGRALLPFIADAVPGWFDPVLTIYDPDGKQVLYADDFRFHPDPLVLFRAPRDGDYTLELRDVLYRGRGDFVYRLKLGSLDAIRPDLAPMSGPIDGTIAAGGESDTFPIQARKGDRLVMEVQARRFGSPLDSLLTLLDERGRTVAENDDWTDPSAGLTTHQADSRISHTFAAPGNYTLRLRDVQGKGGDEYAYRLVIGPPRPDFALRIAPDNPRVGQGQTTAIAVNAVRRDDFAGEIKLLVEDLPEGFTASDAVITAGQNDGRLTITAPHDAPTGVVSPRIVGTASVGSRTAVPSEGMMQAFAYTHYLPTERLYLAVVPPAAFAITADKQTLDLKPGEEAQVVVKVRRMPGAQAGVTVLPQRLANSAIVTRVGQVPPDKDEVAIAVIVDKEAKPGLRQDLILSAVMRAGTQTITRYARAITVRVSVSDPGKQALARSLGDRQHRGMLQPPLHRDRVEALQDGVDSPDRRHAVEVPDLLLDRRVRHEQAGARLSEGLHQRRVLELPDQLRPDTLLLEPLLQRPPQAGALHRQQERRAVERRREVRLVPGRQPRRAEHRHRGGPEQVVVRLHGNTGRHRRVREHDIDRVLGKVREKTVGRVLVANDLHRLGHREHRLEDPIRQQLRHEVGNPDHQAQRPTARPPLENVLQLTPEAEDLVRVPEDHLPDFRECQASAPLREQLLTERLLQLTQLSADRRLCQPELLARSRNAALLRDGPEV